MGVVDAFRERQLRRKLKRDLEDPGRRVPALVALMCFDDDSLLLDELVSLGSAAVPALIAVLPPTFATGEVDLRQSSDSPHEALRRIGEPAVAPLITAMNTTPQAHRVLGMIGGRRCLQALRKEMRHPDWRRREAACFGLCRMEDPIVCEAWPDLVSASDDSVGEVVMAAGYAVKHIRQIQGDL